MVEAQAIPWNSRTAHSNKRQRSFMNTNGREVINRWVLEVHHAFSEDKLTKGTIVHGSTFTKIGRSALGSQIPVCWALEQHIFPTGPLPGDHRGIFIFGCIVARGFTRNRGRTILCHQLPCPSLGDPRGQQLTPNCLGRFSFGGTSENNLCIRTDPASTTVAFVGSLRS